MIFYRKLRFFQALSKISNEIIKFQITGPKIALSKETRKYWEQVLIRVEFREWLEKKKKREIVWKSQRENKEKV